MTQHAFYLPLDVKPSSETFVTQAVEVVSESGHTATVKLEDGTIKEVSGVDVFKVSEEKWNSYRDAKGLS